MSTVDHFFNFKTAKDGVADQFKVSRQLAYDRIVIISFQKLSREEWDSYKKLN